MQERSSSEWTAFIVLPVYNRSNFSIKDATGLSNNSPTTRRFGLVCLGTRIILWYSLDRSYWFMKKMKFFNFNYQWFEIWNTYSYTFKANSSFYIVYISYMYILGIYHFPGVQQKHLPCHIQCVFIYKHKIKGLNFNKKICFHGHIQNIIDH